MIPRCADAVASAAWPAITGLAVLSAAAGGRLLVSVLALLAVWVLASVVLLASDLTGGGAR